MKIKIPKSLFDHINHLEETTRRYSNYNYLPLNPKNFSIQGPYGAYEVVSVPDKDFTVLIREEMEEKVIIRHEIREYKNED